MASFTLTNVTETILENRWSAEFFEPQYKFKPNEIYNWVRIGRILTKCQYGLSLSMNENGKGYPIFRMNEIDNCFTTKAVKHADISYGEFLRYRLNIDDVLFNRTNSIDFVGRTGIYKSGDPSVFASYLVRVNTDRSRILPEFLATYLNTKFGKGQIRRRAMHSINQANVSAAELRRILIPLINIEKQTEIANIVNRAFDLKMQSQDHYTQANNLLNEALGLKDIQFKKEKSYLTNLSDIVNNKRHDAGFYQPKYVQLIEQLKRHDLKLISHVSEKLETGIYSSKYDSKGMKYVRGTDIEENGLINEKSLLRTSIVNPNHKTIAQPYDILVTRVGSIGVTGIVLSSEKMLFSDNLIRIRINWKYGDKINPLYLLLFLKSINGQMLMTRYSRGSVQQRLNQSQLGEIPVPIIDLNIQNEISDLIEMSFKNRDQSNLLLEQAKNEVETLIEQAANQS